jgi:hypothetical protein
MWALTFPRSFFLCAVTLYNSIRVVEALTSFRLRVFLEMLWIFKRQFSEIVLAIDAVLKMFRHQVFL